MWLRSLPFPCIALSPNTTLKLTEYTRTPKLFLLQTKHEINLRSLTTHHMHGRNPMYYGKSHNGKLREWYNYRKMIFIIHHHLRVIQIVYL